MIGCVLCAFRERACGLQWKADPILRWTKVTVQEFCMQKTIMNQRKSFLKQLWFPFKGKIQQQMKQDHFTEDSKHKKMKWFVSTCPKVWIKCSIFGVSQTDFCRIYFVGVIIPFPFCPCPNLLYFVYSAPSNMAAPVSWGASGRVEGHSLTPSSVLHTLVARFPQPLQAVSLDRKTLLP